MTMMSVVPCKITKLHSLRKKYTFFINARNLHHLLNVTDLL